MKRVGPPSEDATDVEGILSGILLSGYPGPKGRDDWRTLTRAGYSADFACLPEHGSEPIKVFKLEPLPNQTWHIVSSVSHHEKRFVDAKALVERLLFLGREEVFEDGMHSVLSKELMQQLGREPEGILDALLAISHSVESRDANSVAEILRWLGHVEFDDEDLSQKRFSLLINALFSNNDLIKDGAALGLSFLGNPAAVPYLEQAAEIGANQELKNDILSIVREMSPES